LNKNHVRIHIIGTNENLSQDIRDLLDKARNLTAGNSGLNLVIAFNYGARDEIVRAAKKLNASVIKGKIEPEAINEDIFSAHLDTAGQPDPDLIIRTSGEMRLSNFLLWQMAYAELCFIPQHWPDFSVADFDAVIADFFGRERRFGTLKDSQQA